MLKLTFAITLALCATAAPLPALQQEALTIMPARPLRETPCEFCEGLVQSVFDFLNDVETRDRVTAFLDQAVCSALPPNFEDMCKEEVPLLLASALAALADAASPKELCQLAGACDPALSLATPWTSTLLLARRVSRRMGGPLDCPVCRMLVLAFKTRLEDPAGHAKLEADVRAACDSLPLPEAQVKCQQDVTDFFQALDALIGDIDPDTACQLADFCDASGLNVVKPAAVKRLAELTSQLSHTPTGGLQADEHCDMCKTIVIEAKVLLANPQTQEEILEYAREGCGLFTDFKQQCLQYVNLYGPLVLNMGLTYLQPETLCAQLGYCPVPPPLLIAS